MSKVLAGVIVVLAIGLAAGGLMLSKREQGGPLLSSSHIPWDFNGQVWQAQGDAPPCPSPLTLAMPVEVERVTALLYPGQYRSQNNYKPHGGFAFEKSKNEDITVTAPIDGYLVKASRYIEAGEVQYLLFFINPCGVMYKLDHLAALSPKFQEIIETLPAAKPDDSRTTSIEPPVFTGAGEVIATSVGFRNINGNPTVSMDLGLVDLRRQNRAAEDPAWMATRTLEGDLEYAPYSLCVFDHFAPAISERLKRLPAYDQIGGKKSDYCKTGVGT